ncbi:hypothetical protein [Variovorax ginsengisoli]|uniref:Uncharacterized protein n=1 Tax=Variovorax ginsengisoli TaxID=363844 RepID=A0ABT9SEE5_9BURK|nr:hypothetical protein [Variovorax ginsengisoli]MDP9902738.1 hypothetical protein [Variovorax ginsengisoli]
MLRNSALALREILADLQDASELFASRNTLIRVEAHLLLMAQTLAHLAPALHERLLLADWRGWQSLQEMLENDIQPRHDAVWYALRALVPTTLEMIDVLRRREPIWFELGY